MDRKETCRRGGTPPPPAARSPPVSGEPHLEESEQNHQSLRNVSGSADQISMLNICNIMGSQLVHGLCSMPRESWAHKHYIFFLSLITLQIYLVLKLSFQIIASHCQLGMPKCKAAKLKITFKKHLHLPNTMNQIRHNMRCTGLF